ncbi:hypothetical protein ACVINI_006459 [Rhizobium beringeri]
MGMALGVYFGPFRWLRFSGKGDLAGRDPCFRSDVEARRAVGDELRRLRQGVNGWCPGPPSTGGEFSQGAAVCAQQWASPYRSGNLQVPAPPDGYEASEPRRRRAVRWCGPRPSNRRHAPQFRTWSSTDSRFATFSSTHTGSSLIAQHVSAVRRARIFKDDEHQVKYFSCPGK